MQVRTTENFIEKAKQIHGDKYDYSLVNYINARTKVKIICPEHGVFEQYISNHFRKKGCPKCANNVKHSTNSFIEKAKIIHHNLYNYSLVSYKNNYTKIKIICSIHGIFEQKPNKHLLGQGCPKCAGKNFDLKLFIEKANKIHNFKYDYSLTVYNKIKDKMYFICPDHGLFIQGGYKHLDGQGCPRCALQNIVSKGEKEVLEYIKSIYTGKILENTRKIISPYELDIYLPDLKIGIEFNGIYWHKLHELKKPGYHKLKYNLCKEKGIKLINILDINWSKNKEKYFKKIEKYIIII